MTASPEQKLQFGPYVVLQQLGEGGMGTVYLAEQREPVRRRVALKVLRPGMDGKAFLARFDAERQALSMMEHSSIARVYDAGATPDGRPYLAMEYVKGVPITDYCDDNKLSIADRLELFRAVCSGVQHAHTKGVMHRDLKPSNVLVTVQDGKPNVKIIDFGLAKAVDHRLIEATLVTEAGQILGTPEYMSPEQAGIGALDVDTRTDIYSLGVLLYQLLTGSLPVTREELLRHGMMEMQRLIREGEPKKPSTRITTMGPAAAAHAKARQLPLGEFERRLRGDLDWIVMKAIEKDRARRYETAHELAADVLRHLRNEPVTAGPPTAGYLLRKLLRRYRAQVMGAGAALLALTVGLVVAVWQWGKANQLEIVARNALVHFRQIADGSMLDELARQAEAAREGSAQEPELAKWVDRAEGLIASMPDHATELTELRRAGKRAGDAWLFDSQEQQLRHDRLQTLLPDLERFRGPSGALALMRERLEWARRIRKVTVDDQQDAWRQAAASVRGNRVFHQSLDLKPQEGLIPLGDDPHSGLPEFWMPRSGAQPVRDGGQLVISNETGIVLVLVPGGTVRLGSPAKNPAGEDNPPNEVAGPELQLDPFLLGKYELTQAQWMRLAHRPNPSRYQNPPNPVEQISWTDAMAVLDQYGLRLPTEPQWEYCCRAGTTTEWEFGDRVPGTNARERFACVLRAAAGDKDKSDHCRFNVADGFQSRSAARGFHPNAAQWPELDDGFAATAPVGSFEANPFGFYDMHGNVAEMTRGTYSPYSSPVRYAPGDGELQGANPSEIALRGGSWSTGVDETRCAARKSTGKAGTYHSVGLRVERPLDR